MVVMASGGLTAVESTELITMGQMVDAMKVAGAVAAKFRPPGKWCARGELPDVGASNGQASIPSDCPPPG
jgi:hypothetical protein